MPVDAYPLGVVPPLGQVPRFMYAQTIREERFGSPLQAFVTECVEVPDIGSDECLILVMAAGVNYNGIWAAAGAPLNPIAFHRKEGDLSDFHIGGSDASGIVYRVGKDVRDVSVGDEVVVHGGWDSADEFVSSGGDMTLAPSFRAWGYETNYGSFAQFARVKGRQLLPKPPHLSWEAAAAYLVNSATAYRALYGFPEHQIRENDVVLIWGAAGGLGCYGVQLCRLAGAIPIGVVSDDQRAEYCLKLGAKGVINRTRFNHWGQLPHWSDLPAYEEWLKGARAFGRALWDAVGARRNPRIVFEHPGEDTIPTSCFVCDSGGMVVICAGTTGYQATLDLRHHWVRQKRLQGTHFANLQQVRAVNELMMQKKMDPCLTRVFTFAEIGLAHQLLADNRHPGGNMAVLVSASAPGQGCKL